MRNTVSPTVTTLESYHTAREFVPRKSPTFLGRATSWSKPPISGVPRSTSLGSIDELRSNSFVSSQQRIFSVPYIPSRQSSLVGWSRSAPKEPLRRISICDVEDMTSLNRLHRDPMFVGIQEGHQVDFVLPPSNMHSSLSSPSRLSSDSRSSSYRSMRQKEATPLLVRSSSTASGLEQTHSKAKIALFVPSQIVKPASGRLPIPERLSSRAFPEAAVKSGDAHEGVPSKRQENHSKEALSEKSDWSTTVQFEASKEEVFRPKSRPSITPALNLNGNQEYQAKDGRCEKAKCKGGGRVRRSNPDQVDSLAGSQMEGEDRPTRGLRVMQTCNAYIERIKRHLRKRFHEDSSTV